MTTRDDKKTFTRSLGLTSLISLVMQHEQLNPSIDDIRDVFWSTKGGNEDSAQQSERVSRSHLHRVEVYNILALLSVQYPNLRVLDSAVVA